MTAAERDTASPSASLAQHYSTLGSAYGVAVQMVLAIVMASVMKVKRLSRTRHGVVALLSRMVRASGNARMERRPSATQPQSMVSSRSDVGRPLRGKYSLCERYHRSVVTRELTIASGEKCRSSEVEILNSFVPGSDTGCAIRNTCCPKTTPLYDCSWKGTASNCGNAKCEYNQVAIARSSNGDNSASQIRK